MSSTTKTARDVILAPVVSEKSYSLISDGNTFRVHVDAHRTQVKQAVEEIFDVKVASVNMIAAKPKPKRRGIYRGSRPGFKKAIVTLREGYSIAFYEGVG